MLVGINGERCILPTETKSKYEVNIRIEGIIKGVRQIQDRGRVQIPKVVRDKLNLKVGDDVYWVENPDGKMYITKAVKL